MVTLLIIQDLKIVQLIIQSEQGMTIMLEVPKIAIEGSNNDIEWEILDSHNNVTYLEKK